MPIPQSEIDELKSRVDLRVMVSQDLGKPIGYSKNPIMFKSPFRASERSASFAVYPDHTWDFGDPSQGALDHIAYAQKRMGMSFTESVEYLRKLAGMPEIASIEHQAAQKKSQSPRKVPIRQVEFYRKNLAHVSDYLEQRAIPYTTAVENGMGGDRYEWDYITADHRSISIQRQRVSIPYMAGSQALSIEFRRDELYIKKYITAHPGLIDMIRIDLSKKNNVDPETISDDEVITVLFGSRYYRPHGISTHVFGLNSVTKQLENGKYVTRKLPWAILSEGALDSAAAQGLGFRTALGVKANNNIDLRTVLRDCRLKFIAQDNDEDKVRPNGERFNPGREHALRLYNQLTGGQFDPTVQIIRIPSPYKDLDDMAIAGVLTDFLAQKQFRIYPIEVEF